MAYAAVISLKHTIHRLLNSSRISIVSPGRETLEFAYKEVESLQRVLKRLDKSKNRSERVKALEGQIREAAYKLEDLLESHVSDQFLSQSEILAGDEDSSLILSLDLQTSRQDIDCFAQTAKKTKKNYMEELYGLFPEEEEDGVLSSRTDVGGNKTKMVGLSDEYHEIRDHILTQRAFTNIRVVGMAGIGKTTLTKKIFEDPLILRRFECRAFVRMGQKFQLKGFLQAILTQVNPDGNKMLMEGEEKCLRKSLIGRRYLIVLDDVWNADFWPDFKKSLPEDGNGSVILVTTRLEQVARSMHYSNIFKIRFLNKDESWDLLCGNVFAKKLCPPQLEKVGKKIAENCEGLPLLIVTVADLLTKAEKTPECWNKVAESKESSIFVDAYDQIAKVLYPSYNFLPQYLKACFLYMGAFPENYEVRCSKLINLWSAEGLLEPNPSQSLEDFAVECFQELVFSNLVVVRKESRSSDRVKACNLHAIYRHLCKKEAGNKRFLHILNSYADGFAEDIESQRRISIYKNILLSIKDVYNSMASISTVRSLLCFGTYHHYNVPICFDLRLLRVLDALTIRFYEFPMEALNLVQLKYFALTYNGKLPLSISKLWNLQYLIVYQHLSIKSSVAESYLPMEIWDLQELKYLEIMGRNLPNPPPGAVLRNLLTLLDVGTHSCTKGILQSIPNLEKLRVQIELAVDSDESFRFFDHISYLCELKSLKCAVMNPKLRSEIVAPISPLPVFTYRLQNLTLSGFGYPWKYMSKIAELPFLQALKLQCYAFQGEKWKVEKKGFLKLKYLIIEDTDLVQWTVGDKSFPLLRFLIIKNCYKLKEIPTVYSLLRIELVDCNPSAVTCAKRMEAIYVHVYANSSWDDGNLKS